jgi:hypothetical protein
MVSMYLPCFIFLVLVATVFAVPFAIFVHEKRKAILLSTITYTVVGKTWAYFSLGGFDLTFLLLLAGTGAVVAIGMVQVVEHFRSRATRIA